MNILKTATPMITMITAGIILKALDRRTRIWFSKESGSQVARLSSKIKIMRDQVQTARLTTETCELETQTLLQDMNRAWKRF